MLKWITYLYKTKFIFSFKERRGLQRQMYAGKTQCSVSQRRVRLRAVLVSTESDYVQC